MQILRIEHKVQNYDGWKKAFDADPLHRKSSGVRVHRILRPAGEPDHVIVDLEFDDPSSAESMIAGLRKLWGEVEGKIIFHAQFKLLDVVEIKKY